MSVIETGKNVIDAPHVSVIIPAYNIASFVEETLASVFAQSFQNFEVVIVNDGSTDDTFEYLNWLDRQGKPVKILNLPENVGRSEARNIGNDAAVGDIICVLDADDIATPNRAELTVRRFKKSQVDLIYGPATMMDAIGNPLRVLHSDVWDREARLKDLTNGICHSTVAYTKAFSQQYKYRSGDIASLGIDDWAMIIEASLGGASFDMIPQRLACYRALPSSVTNVRDPETVKAAKLAFLESLKVAA